MIFKNNLNGILVEVPIYSEISYKEFEVKLLYKNLQHLIVFTPTKFCVCQ